MKLIIVRFRSNAEFLARYEHALEYGGVFVPGRSPPVSGEHVVLDVRMPDLHDSVMIRGKVIWSRRGRRSNGQRAGMSVEFAPSEGRKRDFLLALARGHQVSHPNGARRHARLPIHIPGDWWRPDENTRHSCTVANIGSGGAFLRTQTVLPRGTTVVLEVAMPGSVAQHAIEGRVAWRNDTPGQEGIGIEFRSRDMAGKQRIREIVRRLRDAMNA